MKKSLLSFLAGAAIFAVSLSSCTSDPCKDVNCGTNGTCVEGNCECDPGYEGTSCETEMRAKFLGTYVATGSLCCGSIGKWYYYRNSTYYHFFFVSADDQHLFWWWSIRCYCKRTSIDHC